MTGSTATKRTANVRDATRSYNKARNYHEAANELHAVSEKGPKDKRHALRDPTYFLYLHTVELALIAFLLLKVGSTNGRTHQITLLYEKCRNAGLVVDRDDRVTVTNIVNLLEAGNKDHGFRYFSQHSTLVPELGWTRDVVDRLMKSIASAIEAIDPQAFKPGKAVKFSGTVGPVT